MRHNWVHQSRDKPRQQQVQGPGPLRRELFKAQPGPREAGPCAMQTWGFESGLDRRGCGNGLSQALDPIDLNPSLIVLNSCGLWAKKCGSLCHPQEHLPPTGTPGKTRDAVGDLGRTSCGRLLVATHRGRICSRASGCSECFLGSRCICFLPVGTEAGSVFEVGSAGLGTSWTWA